MKKTDELDEKLEEIKLYLNPEERIIKTCFEKGATYASAGNHRLANKYFTKIMNLSNSNSPDYKLAKSRIKNV